MADAFALLQLLLDELHIKAAECALPISTVSDFPDLGLRALLFGETAPFHENLPPLDRAEGGRAKVYLIRDRYLCKYFFSPDLDEAGRYWLVGPYLNEEPMMRDITGLCKRLELPTTCYSHLRMYYKMVPKLRDQNMLEALFRSHFALRYAEEGFELIPWEMDIQNRSAPVKCSAGASLELRDFLERTYFTERKMMDCITEGNYAGAAVIYPKLQANGLEARTDSILRDGKNSLITFNTLCRVAAYRGGVHPSDLDKWTREFIIRIENATNVHDIEPLSFIMLEQYCELARSADTTRYSPVIRKVLDHISGSFNSDITLKDLAAQFGINPSYLSTLFKKELGKSFTEYLTEKRLALAVELLIRTDLPIGDIAIECGIPDNNYFARIFKAQMGISPLQYRQSHS